MINNVSGGPYINVIGGATTLPYVTPNPSNPLTGMVRIYGNQFEVFNGSAWMMLPTSITSIGVDGSAIAALTWVQNKMSEESKLKELAKTNVTIADAIAKVKEAQDQLNVLVTLTSETPTSET